MLYEVITTNEYFINNEKCRLKDITDILLDSGIAKESFNIISQGKIDDILSNRPQDRRVIFEEAAGVLKYKRRKEEALRKLDRTHDNMSRVEDIIGDVITSYSIHYTKLYECHKKHAKISSGVHCDDSEYLNMQVSWTV